MFFAAGQYLKNLQALWRDSLPTLPEAGKYVFKARFIILQYNSSSS